jgi:hypothetical protein
MIVLILFAITSNTWVKLAYLAERDTGMSRDSAKNIVLTIAQGLRRSGDGEWKHCCSLHIARLLFLLTADVTEHVRMDVQTDVGHVVKMLACNKPDDLTDRAFGVIA